MNKSRTVIRRHQYADYLNLGTAEAAKWVLMGTGFTTLDEEPGAQTESVKYVNEVSSSSSIVSYETTFPFEAEQIATEEAITAIYEVGRNHYVGADAEFEYCRVELWNPAGAAEDAGHSFEARKFVVAVEVSDFTGENKMTISGNLNAVGDPILGTFDTTALAFAPAA